MSQENYQQAVRAFERRPVAEKRNGAAKQLFRLGLSDLTALEVAERLPGDLADRVAAELCRIKSKRKSGNDRLSDPS